MTAPLPTAPTPGPTAGKALCAVYGVIALAALVATQSQALAYFDNPGGVVAGFGEFLRDTAVTPASRFISFDVAFLFLAAAVFMVIEARRLRIRYVWAYIAGGLLVAISVTFPLFLIARELRIAARRAE